MKKHLIVLATAACMLALGCEEDGNESSSSGGNEAGTGVTAGMGAVDAGMQEDAAVGPKDIVATAIAAGNFTKLAEALTSADLVGALQGDGPFTVFAPDDDAFAAFEAENPGVLAGLSKEDLTAILTYHVVSGKVLSTDLTDGAVSATLNGSPVLFDLDGGAMVNDANVTTADIEASNGVIHVIDTIILPPKDDLVATAIAAGNFTQLAGALTAAELVDDLQGEGPFTVFAPTDDAFAKLAAVPSGDDLKNVLLYHVVSGLVGSGNLSAGEVPTLLTDQSVTISLEGGAKVNDASITTTDILTKNGVIHVIDTVLVPN